MLNFIQRGNGHKFEIFGILNNVLNQNSVQKQSSLKVYYIFATPSLLQGSEIWTSKQRDERRLKTAEMKFVTCTRGCSFLNHTRNEDILKELKVGSVKNILVQHKQKWLYHVRTEDIRHPKHLDY
jgi:hypothetical protein